MRVRYGTRASRVDGHCRFAGAVSVGIEDEADLLTDFTQALDATAVA
jgi:O-acetylhomoserine/O-acetylserine sulfhydrylase-like pyridoxal-dependent enzyme